MAKGLNMIRNKDFLLNSKGGKYNALDVIDSTTGIVIAEAGDELTEDLISKIIDKGTTFSVLRIDYAEVGGLTPLSRALTLSAPIWFRGLWASS